MKPGRDDEPARVDLPRAALPHLPHGADAPVGDGHVRPPPGRTSAVHHESPANHEIDHQASFPGPSLDLRSPSEKTRLER